jgi:hypothetical protein
MNFRDLSMFGLLLAACVTRAVAGLPVPEVDGASAGGALALIGGAALIIRSRRSRRP